MTAGAKRPPITAAELMRQLQADPDFVGQMAQRSSKLTIREAELNRAEAPIVADLRAVGVAVDSVWDLVNTSEAYPAAVPVLMDHLQRGGYPDRVTEGVARALAVGPVTPWWFTLRDMYLTASGPDTQEGLAVALSATASADHIADVLALVEREDRGSSRVHLLSALRRVGDQRGMNALRALRQHPVLGIEASALVRRGRPAPRKRG